MDVNSGGGWVDAFQSNYGLDKDKALNEMFDRGCLLIPGQNDEKPREINMTFYRNKGEFLNLSKDKTSISKEHWKAAADRIMTIMYKDGEKLNKVDTQLRQSANKFSLSKKRIKIKKGLLRSDKKAMDVDDKALLEEAIGLLFQTYRPSELTDPGKRYQPRSGFNEGLETETEIKTGIRIKLDRID